jgi:hypothetical protein
MLNVSYTRKQFSDWHNDQIQQIHVTKRREKKNCPHPRNLFFWWHDSVPNHIAGCLKSALQECSWAVLWLGRTASPAWRVNLGWSHGAGTEIRPCHPWLVSARPGRHRIAMVKLTFPWDTDAKRPKKQNTLRCTDIKTALRNEGWDSNLYMNEVGARGHILKSVKDRLWSLFWAWVPAGHR